MQINNWIKVDGEIVQVKAILEGKFIVKGKGDQKIAGTWEPVKLTRDILKRFDLTHTDEYQKFEIDDIDGRDVVLFRNGLDIIFIIDSLHELQDFYRFWAKAELPVNPKQ